MKNILISLFILGSVCAFGYAGYYGYNEINALNAKIEEQSAQMDEYATENRIFEYNDAKRYKDLREGLVQLHLKVDQLKKVRGL